VRSMPRARRMGGLGLALVGIAALSLPASAWGPQGHRLVARVAEKQLTSAARQNVVWLLDGASLADVSTWADGAVDSLRQTGPWHYVNIPSAASGYNRDRDCPRQPGAASGSRADRWRDCIVDRILFHQERLADRSLDRADRAVALKFLVHLVGDIHQPFHAFAEERGGNGIFVSVFGSTDCGTGGRRVPCNLHGVWDSGLLARRRLSDDAYIAQLERGNKGRRPAQGGMPADWAKESHDYARAALLPDNGAVDDSYFQRQIGVVDERLAAGGQRLAALLNESLSVPPPRR
jgi:hypothetical protein